MLGLRANDEALSRNPKSERNQDATHMAKWINSAGDILVTVFSIYFIVLIITSILPITRNAQLAIVFSRPLVFIHFALAISFTLFIIITQIEPIIIMMLIFLVPFSLLLVLAWVSGVIERRKKRE